MKEREIKFRAWDSKNKYMVDSSYGDWISLNGIPYTEAQTRYDTPNIEIEKAKNYILMQYTGLKDKDGEEIYEGDVMQKMIHDYYSEEYQNWEEGGYKGDEPKPTIVKRDVVSLEHFRYWLKNESFGYEGEDIEDPTEWERIGNIYQNPELLTV
jgi:uncharacterized phage protein (TIGR01671 family)